jgi:hypothetical protein
VLIRGTIAVIVGPVLGETTPHLPIYLAEAALVELAALALIASRRRRTAASRPEDDRLPNPLALGAVSGALIGTVGFAAEYGWSQFAMPLPWTDDLLPEAIVLATIAGVAGGLVGGLLGAALRGELPRGAVVRVVPATALAAVMLAFGVGLLTSVPEGVRAHVTLDDVSPRPNREVDATVRFDPAGAVSDPAWLTVTAWQGDGLVVDQLERSRPGVYRTTQPFPVNGSWKTLVRLQQGDQVLGVPIYLPEDAAIPAPKVAAAGEFTRPVSSDHEILQREQKQDVPGWLDTVAHLVVLGIALSLLGTLAWGLGRIGHPEAPQERRRQREHRAAQPVGAR